jgi:hypothetical protein
MRAHDPSDERTSFQEAGPFDPRIDSGADVAMVYGINDSFEQRVQQWRDAGYRVHVMTGVAWGHYTDYVRGEWDGVPHFDDAQTADGNFRLEHGVSQGRDIYYMMPSLSYVRYLSDVLKRVVDAGALALHLEEPEFWVRAGYEESFKREWQTFYDEPWMDPKSSVDARYRAGKLMQHLYTRALSILCDDLKRYAHERGIDDFKCYAPTHSLLNYAHWRIVSPESKLLEVSGCDGLIGQVWTGTSRTPVVYRGMRRERPFEAGLCEYAACAAISRNSRLKLWQLADPIEDNPNYCWDDYRMCWESDVVASLLNEDSTCFEIMPWPSRIFTRTYPATNVGDEPLVDLVHAYVRRLEQAGKDEQANHMRSSFDAYLDFLRAHGNAAREETLGFADTETSEINSIEQLRMRHLLPTLFGYYKHLATWEDKARAMALRDVMAEFFHDPVENREPIPPAYAIELQTVFNALRDMHWPDDTAWMSGQSGVAVVIADSLMFQRGAPHASDPDMSSFYGQAMPLVKAGVALTLAQLERVHEPDALRNIDVLLLTYEGMKPPNGQAHDALAAWVRAGHTLILFGAGDAYNEVREWWNSAGMDYASPCMHLTEACGLGSTPASGVHVCGNGFVVIEPASPAALAHLPDGADVICALVQQAMLRMNREWRESNVLALRRGSYVIASGMDETNDIGLALEGIYVNLFDASLGLVTSPRITGGTRWLLCDVSRRPDHAWVLACAGRVMDERVEAGVLRFIVRGMSNTRCAVRIAMPSKPARVTFNGQAAQGEWDEASRTLLLQFDHQPAGVIVEVD